MPASLPRTVLAVGLMCLAASCVSAGPASAQAAEEAASPTTRGVIAFGVAPINTACPVAGTKADPEVTTTYQGKTVAFCCGNCKGKFNADPAKFADKLPAAEPDANAPDDATILVGDDVNRMVPEPRNNGEAFESKWVFEQGVLTASPSWDSVITPDNYTDFRLHVEFNVNDKPGLNLENNGNSGVYIQQRYEIQIQNAHGIAEEDFKHTYGGSIYKFKKPDALVSKPAGEWQTYDIVFRAARFDGDTKTENARITVYHNGTLIHDDVELPNKTGAGRAEGPEPGPIKLQGHNNPVQFRNVWVQPLELE